MQLPKEVNEFKIILVAVTDKHSSLWLNAIVGIRLKYHGLGDQKGSIPPVYL